jgi:hypothetical protein
MRPRIIRNSVFPFGKYIGITLYPFIFIKDDSARLLRHELIHFYQIREEGFFKFYFRYLWERIRKPYREISFEAEAYEHQHDEDYLPPDLEALVNG